MDDATTRRPSASAEADLALPPPEARAAAAAAGMSVALWASVTPASPAVISPAGDRTFAELDRRSNQLVRALRSRGITTGDTVALVCSNRAEFAEVVQACLRAGLRYTPINWHLTAAEIAYIVDDCDGRAIVGDAKFSDHLAEVARSCPAASVRLAVGGPIEEYEDYETALAAESGAPPDQPSLGWRMLYTSGTTGRPKGVIRPPTYATHLEAITTAPRYEAGTGQLNLCTGPLYHGGPLGFSLAMPLAQGVGIVLMERWDAATALELIERHRITHTHMVPTMFHRLLRLPEKVRRDADVSSLTYVLHGAAPCPVETKAAMLDWFGPVLWEYFASTEGSGASIGPEDWRRKPGSVGRPDADHVRILDEEGRECDPETPGAIHLRRSPGADFEYHNDPEKTERTRRGDYFSMGDIGYLDEDGYLFVTDRDADVIISGGVNIYPAEVEAALLAHPAVRDAAVIGVPNQEWGEEVKGVVEISADRPDGPPEAADLIEFCRDRLAHFKCPRSIDLVDRLPRQDNGKLYRNRVREGYRRDADGG